MSDLGGFLRSRNDSAEEQIIGRRQGEVTVLIGSGRFEGIIGMIEWLPCLKVSGCLDQQRTVGGMSEAELIGSQV